MSGCLVADVVSYYTVSATGKGKGIAKVNPTISYARARMSSCLVANVISYCLCCWLKPLMENCYVEDMSWREWQEAKERQREIEEAKESDCYTTLKASCTHREP